MTRSTLLARSFVLASVLGALALPARSLAQPAAAARSPEPPAAAGSPWHFDLEIDPTAYALSGYSLHAGVGYAHLRLDLGAYAMDLPEFVHGNDELDVAFHGFGAKLQLFPFAEQSGFFVGVDGGVAQVLAEQRASGLAASGSQISAGVNVGYRIPIASGFYVTPWIGLGYVFGAQDLHVLDSTLKAMPVTVFPAIHLGYRVR